MVKSKYFFYYKQHSVSLKILAELCGNPEQFNQNFISRLQSEKVETSLDRYKWFFLSFIACNVIFLISTTLVGVSDKTKPIFKRSEMMSFDVLGCPTLFYLPVVVSLSETLIP